MPARQTLLNAERVKRQAEASKVVATHYRAEAKRLLTEARQAQTNTESPTK